MLSFDQKVLLSGSFLIFFSFFSLLFFLFIEQNECYAKLYRAIFAVIIKVYRYCYC